MAYAPRAFPEFESDARNYEERINIHAGGDFLTRILRNLFTVFPASAGSRSCASYMVPPVVILLAIKEAVRNHEWEYSSIIDSSVVDIHEFLKSP